MSFFGKSYLGLNNDPMMYVSSQIAFPPSMNRQKILSAALKEAIFQVLCLNSVTAHQRREFETADIRSKSVSDEAQLSLRVWCDSRFSILVSYLRAFCHFCGTENLAVG